MKLRPLVLLFTALNLAVAQNLTSPQATAVAGFSTFVNSALSSTVNPAGLMRIYDWNIGLTGYYKTYSGTKMHSIGIAKRLTETQSLGFIYSPGSSIEFVFPSTVTINIGTSTLRAEFQRKITYSSNYTLTYALKLSNKISLGSSVQYISQNLVETGYKIQPTDSLPQVSLETSQYQSSNLNSKISLLYEVTPKMSLALLFENLSLGFGRFPEQFKNFEFEDKFKIKASAGLDFKILKSGFEVSSIGEFRTGFEVQPIKNLFLRSGLFSEKGKIGGFSTGVGFRSGLFQFDLAYFKNTSNVWKDGKLTQDEFFETLVKNPEFEKFTRDEVTFSISVDMSRWYEKSLRVKSLRIEDEIFPHMLSDFEKRNIGSVEIENTSDKVLNAKIDFKLSFPLDIEAEPNEFEIKPRETKTIPISISLGTVNPENNEPIKIDALLNVKSTSDIPDEVKKFKIFLRGRNDWNGNVEDLKSFLKFDSPEISSFARIVILEHKDTLEKIDPALRKFYQAKFIFDELSKHIIYVSDPSLSIDKVQFPEETLKLRTGDCDDLAILYASLLGSIGIKVAFVDVKGLRKINESHVYIIFDTEIDKKLAQAITSNEKKYIILKNESGTETAWIPVETTLVHKGFDEAWETGAEQFFNDFEVNLGHTKGKAKIVFIEK